MNGVHVAQTRGGKMEGADESTALWRYPKVVCFSSQLFPQRGIPFKILQIVRST